MNRRSKVANMILALTLISVLLPSNANAVIKPGTACGKKGLVQNYAGKKFTCVLKNKKLVWNQGLSVKTTAPIIKNYLPASKAEIGRDCNVNGVVAFSLIGPLICKSELWQRVDRNYSIRTLAFSSIIERWNKQPNATLKLDIHIDKKAGSWVNEIETGLLAGARFWGTSSSTSPVLSIFISDSHLYIEKELASAGIIQSEDSKRRNADAKGGQAGFNKDSKSGQIYLDFLFKSERNRQDVGYYGVAPHEYTHYAQNALSDGALHKDGGVPWLIEGMASYVGAVLGPMSKMPHDQMDGWINNLKETETELSYFLRGEQDVYQSPRWSDIYPLGTLASEALVALIGFEAVSDIWEDIKSGLNYEQSIKKNSGASLGALTEMLDNYVQSVKKRQPWSLTELQSNFEVIKNQ